MKTIGLFGLTFNSGNKGCAALAYSFLDILNKLNINDYVIKVFTYLPNEQINEKYYNDKMEIIQYSMSTVQDILKLKKDIKKCDVIFDFTEGDSFSDIYGIQRAIKVCLNKELALKNKVPLVLGPQTYGPYNNGLIKKWVKRIVKKSRYVCARDKKSAEVLKNLTGKEFDYYTDIAFALEPTGIEYKLSSSKKVGLNISSLLMGGGYTRDNQFNLTVNYREYVDKLIERINNELGYEIHCIPHVISTAYDSLENDYRACNLIKEKYENVIVSDKFETPMEAKQYISQMDVFIGARMHATVGAFSMGVPTIPFSYSDKFEGLYNSVGYDYIIHGKEMTTEEAVEKTVEYIKKMDDLKKSVQSSNEIINKRLAELYLKIQDILENI